MTTSVEPRHVHFNDNIITYHYEETIPCLQETMHTWEECKRHHLQQVYQQVHGNLVGFDFDKECLISDQEDSKYESLYIPREWLIPFGFHESFSVEDQEDVEDDLWCLGGGDLCGCGFEFGFGVEVAFQAIDTDLQEIQLSDDNIEFLVDLGQ